MKTNLVIISILFFILTDVLLWYILTLYEIENANIICIFIAIIFFTFYITYFSHGKGILYLQKTEQSKNFSINIEFLYKRKKLKQNSFKRKNFNHFEYKKSTFLENKYKRVFK